MRFVESLDFLNLKICYFIIYFMSCTICLEKVFLCFSILCHELTQLYISIYNRLLKMSQGGKCPPLALPVLVAHVKYV